MLFNKSIMKRKNEEKRHREEIRSSIYKELELLGHDPTYDCSVSRTKSLVTIAENQHAIDCDDAYLQGKEHGYLIGLGAGYGATILGLVIGTAVINSMSNRDEEVESE